MAKLFLLLAALAVPPAPSPAHAAEAPLNHLDSSLTLYVYPPRSRIDWSTPGNALRTVVGSLVKIALSDDNIVEFLSDFGERGNIDSSYKSSMGHTIGHVRCRMPGGELYDRWSSFSGQDLREVDKQLLFKEKVGYGTMLYNYVDGHIIAGDENVKRITYYKGGRENGERVRPLYFQVEVAPARCAEIRDMVAFFESFHFPAGSTLEQLQARPAHKVLYFTNQMDPFEGYLARKRGGKGPVGGGCAPYGAALLKASGRYLPQFEELFRTPVSVSEKLIGGLPDHRSGRIRRVSLHDLLHTSLGTRWDWSHEGYRNRFVSMYDPQKIWDFARDVLDCLEEARCSERAAAFLRPNAGKVAPGATRLFEHTLERELRRGGEAADSQHFTEHTKQPVRGFVWRLNPAR